MRIKDVAIYIIIIFFVLIFILPISFLLYDIFSHGMHVIINYGPRFFIDKPPLPGDGLGGIGPAIEGSLYMVSIGMLISGPISFFSALFITFFEKSKISKITRYSLELIVEFPTILTGIVVFSVFVVGISILHYTFKVGFNGISGGIALSIIMLPYSTIQISEVLKLLKRLYEESAYALGLTPWQVFKLIINAGKKGIVTSFLVGFAKIIGETAPIILVTSSTANLYLTSPTTPVTGLPVIIYTFAFSGFSNWVDVAYGASTSLIIIVTIVFIVTKILTKS